jgi:glycosyltransferase involved in cell wall biosynthesis
MDQDGYRAVLQPLIEQLGVAAQVCFVGEVLRDDKAALLSHAAALVLPSYSENFGNVVVESMAAGRPVVITPEVGMADIVRRADAGMVVDGEPAAIGQALSHLIEDASDADRMGGCGRQYVERELTWDAVAGRMERLYSEIRS